MIPCANPLRQYERYEDDINNAISRVLRSGSYILGPEVESFERAFSTYCGTKFGVGVASGTDALILALKALNISAGDEVITVSHTALATVSAIIACDATPVLADVDPIYYTIDINKLRPLITKHTKAIIAVHLYGQCADMDAVMTVANEFGIKVIEDCAQSTGASYKGKMAGSMGDLSCFSFYPTKNLGALGDGGMILTNQEALSARLQALRQYGWKTGRLTQEPGINSRLDEIQAAVLNVKLKGLDSDNNRRRDIAHYYSTHLIEKPILTPKEMVETRHVYHLYVIQTKDREKVLSMLMGEGISAGIHYPMPAHQHGGYQNLCKFTKDGLKVTEDISGEILSLPMFPELTNEEVEKVVFAFSGV